MSINVRRLRMSIRLHLPAAGVFCGVFLLLLALGWPRGEVDQTETAVLASASVDTSASGMAMYLNADAGVALANTDANSVVDTESSHPDEIPSAQPLHSVESSPFDGDVALHGSVAWHARSWHALEVADELLLPIGVTGSMDSAEPFRVTEVQKVQKRSGARRRLVIESMRDDFSGSRRANASAGQQGQCRGLLTFSAHQAYGTLSCPEQSWVLEARDGTLSVASEYWLRLRQAPDADDQHFPPAASI